MDKSILRTWILEILNAEKFAFACNRDPTTGYMDPTGLLINLYLAYSNGSWYDGIAATRNGMLFSYYTPDFLSWCGISSGNELHELNTWFDEHPLRHHTDIVAEIIRRFHNGNQC